MTSIIQSAMSFMETGLMRIERLSKENQEMKFKWLIQHFTKDNLTKCFHELGRKKAVGIDGKSKDEYGKNLEENIEFLIERMKGLKYYPAPVREVKIPKGNGKFRPLGISNIEDKIVQSMFAKVLNAIYEPLFSDSSYGFRPGRSCHNAIRDIHKYVSKLRYGVVIDVDLSNFFGTIDHRKLIQILEIKIKDKTFIRYIVRMLRSGILTDGELKKSDTGTPQGSIVSPVLANIFAHYAIDQWLITTVPKYLHGNIHFVRYADDFVIFTNKRDVPRIIKALKGRLERFSLELNLGKTKVINFSKTDYVKGKKQDDLDYLGFTFYFGRSRKGKALVKIKTNRKTFTKKLKEIMGWCKANRNIRRLNELWKTFISKVRGHIQYYSVSHNCKMVNSFVREATRAFYKWINRRSQRKSFNWEKFSQYMKLRPLPVVKIIHRLF